MIRKIRVAEVHLISACDCKLYRIVRYTFQPTQIGKIWQIACPDTDDMKLANWLKFENNFSEFVMSNGSSLKSGCDWFIFPTEREFVGA